MFHQRKWAVLAGIYAEAELQELAGGTRQQASYAKPDRSLKCSVDEKMAEICWVINAHPDYYTLSCCSGRVSCFMDMSKDTESAKHKGWLVSVAHAHEEILCGADLLNKIESRSEQYKKEGEVGGVEQEGGVEKENVWLRFEPLLLHVRCCSIDAARRLMEVCRVSGGVKDSTIFGIRENVAVDVCVQGSVRMAVPLISEGVKLFSGSNLDLLVLECGRLMGRNDAKLIRLAAALKSCL